jgi:hypothetical protein
MPDPEPDQAAIDAISRAVYKAWPARIVAKAAPGWARVILVALRQDPGGCDAVIAALKRSTTRDPLRASGR